MFKILYKDLHCKNIMAIQEYVHHKCITFLFL